MWSNAKRDAYFKQTHRTPNDPSHLILSIMLSDITGPISEMVHDFAHRHTSRILKSFVSCVVMELLQLCDVVRDDTLPELGVRLEDHEGTCGSITL